MEYSRPDIVVLEREIRYCNIIDLVFLTPAILAKRDKREAKYQDLKWELEEDLELE